MHWNQTYILWKRGSVDWLNWPATPSDLLVFSAPVLRAQLYSTTSFKCQSKDWIQFLRLMRKWFIKWIISLAVSFVIFNRMRLVLLSWWSSLLVLCMGPLLEPNIKMWLRFDYFDFLGYLFIFLVFASECMENLNCEYLVVENWNVNQHWLKLTEPFL